MRPAKPAHAGAHPDPSTCATSVTCSRGPAGDDAAVAPPAIGVYVHFPWCLKKCWYCDFVSIPAESPTIPHGLYADAVVAELKQRVPALRRYALKSIYFGGGTPSLWKVRELGRVLMAIVEAFSAELSGLEVTVECNPCSLDRDHALLLRSTGVNRISLGVQSLDRERLSLLGRLHDPERALGALEAALGAEMTHVSADLIYGVVGLDAEQAAREARTLAGLGATHLSTYELAIESGGRHASGLDPIAAGQPGSHPPGALATLSRQPDRRLLADEDTVAECYLGLTETLGSLGYEHYEISNFAQDGHCSQHNLGYWRGYDYLGLGAGAWGTLALAQGRLRYRNIPVPTRYLAAMLAGACGELWASPPSGQITPRPDTHPPEPGLSPREEREGQYTEWIDAETALREHILLGLRLREGVDLDLALRTLGLTPSPRRARAIESLVQRGLLVLEGSRLLIPEQAWLFANSITASVL
jgi:putative oxygen-independent coproporphyrinogen III oxidase